MRIGDELDPLGIDALGLECIVQTAACMTSVRIVPFWKPMRPVSGLSALAFGAAAGAMAATANSTKNANVATSL
ncbi:hypothetical protein C84B14_05656 [Salinisphaera sp. C84B14]